MSLIGNLVFFVLGTFVIFLGHVMQLRRGLANEP